VAGSLAGTGPSGKSALKSTDATGNAGATRATAATTTSSGAKTLAGSSFGASVVKQPAKTSKPIEEVKDGESSGYSDFDEEEIA